MGDADDRRLLDEQIAYYRARASEYDATSTPDGDPFASIFEPIRMALNELTPSGRVLTPRVRVVSQSPRRPVVRRAQ